jgi:hypothetical protein
MTAPAARLLTLAAAALLSAAALADPGVKLYCAREIAGFADAEMHLREREAHTVDVTFAGLLPARHRLDWALRDCLNTAVKLDGSQDIVVLAWYRPGPGIVEPVRPYGEETKLVYQASRKTVTLRRTVSAQRRAP